MRITRKTIEALAKRAGSIKQLAADLEISASSLHRWKRAGIPKHGKAFDTFKDFVAEYRQVTRPDKTFTELLALASQASEAGELPRKLSKSLTKSGPREGALTVGYRNTVAVDRILTNALSLELQWRFRTMISSAREYSKKKSFDNWQAFVTVATFSRGAHRGYSAINYQLPHPEAGDFTLQQLLITPRMKDEISMLDAIKQIIDEEKNDAGAITFIRQITVDNWVYRDTADTRKYLTAQRYARAKRPKRKTKKL